MIFGVKCLKSTIKNIKLRLIPVNALIWLSVIYFGIKHDKFYHKDFDKYP